MSSDPFATRSAAGSHRKPSMKKAPEAQPRISAWDSVLSPKEKLQTAHHRDQQNGRSQHPRILQNRGVILQIPQQRTPGGQRLGDAQTQQAQIRFAQYEYRNRHPELG